ncbi:YhbD family protein [Haloimpatiens massiliensis]|uniref:YhbD family protein n=1 Tax=Haloimpatiens massiliensis TaxID=1658110 RepID=UPI000C81938E|nr:YhbD family protein [Haloimpatiens massiliensis]
MEEDLISKKELLDLTGISYGQLYRWKRKKLIPEEWFIKKSSFTGQETFFPKDKILDRIDVIKNMKDDLSLDEIANMFTPNLQDISFSKDEVLRRNLVTEMTMNIYSQLYPLGLTLSFEKILHMYILEKFIKSGEVSIEEGKGVLQTLKDNYNNIEEEDYDIILLRKFGAAASILIPHDTEIYIDTETKMVLKINILKCIEEMKIRVN